MKLASLSDSGVSDFSKLDSYSLGLYHGVWLNHAGRYNVPLALDRRTRGSGIEALNVVYFGRVLGSS